MSKQPSDLENYFLCILFVLLSKKQAFFLVKYCSLLVIKSENLEKGKRY